MRRGLPQSLALHAAVLLVVIFGLPHFSSDITMMSAPIPVEVVSPDQVASAPQKAHQPKPQPPKPEPPKPEPPKPPEPEPEPPKPPEPEPEAPQPEDIPTPEPAKPEPPKPEPPKPTPPKPPRPRPTPPKPVQQQTKPEPTKPRDNRFANLLNNLDEPDDKPAREGVADSPVEESPNLSSVLNAGEMDAVRNQVMSCWLEPTGLREGGERMVAEIKVVVNPDRTIKSATVVDKSRMGRDNFYRNLAESAVRAMFNPKCNILQLPPNKYSTWKTIVFRFSPEGIN